MHITNRAPLLNRLLWKARFAVPWAHENSGSATGFIDNLLRVQLSRRLFARQIGVQATKVIASGVIREELFYSSCV